MVLLWVDVSDANLMVGLSELRLRKYVKIVFLVFWVFFCGKSSCLVGRKGGKTKIRITKRKDR